MNNSLKRGLAVATAVAVVFSLGCATAPTTSSDVELKLEQLPDAGFAIEDHGAVSIAYQLSVHNLRNEQLTLKKIEMRTLGESPYTLRETPAEMNEVIPPGGDAQVTFTMWSYPREGRTSAKKSVWVNGVAYFDGPAGSSRKEFTLSFREP